VWGNNAGTGIGVKGTSASGYGVYGSSEGTHGIIGTTSSSGSGGVCGSVTDPVSSGVWGSNSGSGPGTKGTSSSGPGGFFSSAAGVPLHLDPGGTTGHPTSGTFVVGDVYVDAAGSMFLCTKGGTYGTNTPPVWGQVHLTQPIPLVPGWNLVAGPGLSTDVIAQQINAAGGNVQTIAVYSQGRYVTWVPNYSTPFYVPPTDGMFVLTKTPATWTPH
jgi:hypothetical protein